MTRHVVATRIKKPSLKHFGGGKTRKLRFQSENKTGVPSVNHIHFKCKEDSLQRITPQKQKMSETNFNCGSAYT